MARPDDPKGYYARLGIAAWATQRAIDVAFEARARELQPDRKPPDDAAQRHQAILEAHRILSDPVLRRAYDAESVIADEDDEAEIESAATPALPWYRQRQVLVGLVASAGVVLIVTAILHAPGTMVPATARALTPPPLPLPVVPRYERRVVTAAGVNLRLGPGTEHPPARRIARGEAVELLQPETDGWAYVRLGDGRRGYIAARFLAAP